MTQAIVGGVFAALVAVGPTVVAPEKPTIDPDKLVGKWEPREQTGTVGASMEFTKDGKTRAVLDFDGQPLELKGPTPSRARRC